jgi:hypothetical protein
VPGPSRLVASKREREPGMKEQNRQVPHKRVESKLELEPDKMVPEQVPSKLELHKREESKP